VSVSDFMRKVKGCSSHKIRIEFRGAKETLLGASVLGPGLFFDNKWPDHGRHYTSVSGRT